MIGKVTTKDLQELGFCMKQAKNWFRHHGLDFRDFVNNGIDIKTVERIDCELGNKAAVQARKRMKQRE